MERLWKFWFIFRRNVDLSSVNKNVGLSLVWRPCCHKGWFQSVFLYYDTCVFADKVICCFFNFEIQASTIVWYSRGKYDLFKVYQLSYRMNVFINGDIRYWVNHYSLIYFWELVSSCECHITWWGGFATFF